MAMNKKEQAYVKELEEKILQLEALKLCSDKVEPDLPPPANGNQFSVLVKGWSFNSHNANVQKTCSSCINHGFGWEKTSSQNSIAQFSSKELALKGLRYATEQKFAQALAGIDKRIKEASEEGDDVQ